MTPSRTKTVLKNLLRPLVAFAFLYLLVVKGPFQFSQIKFILSQTRILFLGFVLFGIQFVITALRWKVSVDLISKISIKLSLAYTLVGQFFSFFIPGGIGGDVVKALELSRKNSINKSTALSTVVADRLLGLYAMVLFSTIFLCIDYILESSAQMLRYLGFSLILFIAMTLGLWLGPSVVNIASKIFASKNHKLLVALEKLIRSFNLTFRIYRTPSALFRLFLLSLIIQTISNLFMLEVIKALNVPSPSFFIFFALSCFGFLASAIPITPAGIGIGQAAVYFLFSAISQELGKAAVTAVSVLQIFYLFFAIIGGIIFATKPFLRNSLVESTKQDDQQH